MVVGGWEALGTSLTGQLLGPAGVKLAFSNAKEWHYALGTYSSRILYGRTSVVPVQHRYRWILDCGILWILWKVVVDCG